MKLNWTKLLLTCGYTDANELVYNKDSKEENSWLVYGDTTAIV